MTNEYDDIIHLPHHVSKNHPHMSLRDRAAQFSPFAALSGHGAAIKETARLTDQRVELDEYEKEDIREKLNYIAEIMDAHPEITVTYFKPDMKKDGGTYLSVTDFIKKIDEYERLIYMENGTKIPLDEIFHINSGK